MELIESITDTCRKEERQAFDELVHRHHKQAYNIAYRMTGNHTDAEDLTQEAFIRAFRFFGQYRRELPFENWLYRIMSNVFVDMLRRRPKVQIRSFDQPIQTEDGEATMEIADLAPTPEESVLSNELDARIQSALMTMPEEFRLAVVYADIEGLSYEEIADAMRCSIGTVRSRLHRGRKILRERLKTYASG
ncbi:MAG: sigma-70 family RNA polymerase sigma factor [Armatimonadota bacterium]|nr:sigma-70 family RNA polymerase sigma factor [Armatimonadota bacterium]